MPNSEAAVDGAREMNSRKVRFLKWIGMSAKVLKSTATSPTPKMLSDVDHWLMNGTCESTLV